MAAHARDDQAGQARDTELTDALHDYVNAQAGRINGQVALLKSELRLGLLTLMAAAIGGVAAIVLFLTAWVMLMIGLAQYTADFFSAGGANILLLAALNAVGAVGLYYLARSLVLETLRIRPFRKLLG